MSLRAPLAALVLSSGLLATPALAGSLDCPQSQTPEAIAAWRLNAATTLEQGMIPDAEVAAKLKECFGAQPPACLKRTADYASRYDTASSSLDLTITQSPQKRPPEELLAPGATGLEYVLPENIEALAAEKGWPAVRYKSRHSGGFDSGTPSLLMVLVPGDKVSPPVNYDRWLNFAIPADEGADALTPKPQAKVPGAAEYAAEGNGGKYLPRTFTMVTLDRKQGTTPGKVYFQKFYREQTGSPVFKPESSSSPSSCVSCHPNGLRAISPLGYHVRDGEAQLPEEDWKTVELINDAMVISAGNKVISWRDAVVEESTGATKPLLMPKGQGPSVGPMKPLNAIGRTTDFVKSCFNRRTTISVTDIFGRAPGKNNVYKLSAEPQIDFEKVAANMQCASCHNDTGRGALNRTTSWAQIDFKILVDQSMPLGAHQNPLEQGAATAPVIDDLTADERIALTNCLQAEFELEQKQLVKWLTAQTCQ